MRDHDFDLEPGGSSTGDLDDPAALARERALEKVARLLEIERHADAERELRQLLAVQPHDADVLSLLSRVELEQGREEEAKETAYAALAIDAQCVDALSAAAEAHFQLGENSRAEKMLIEALGLEPMNHGLWLDYARLTFKAGQLDKAKRLCERTLAIEPGAMGAHQLLSLIASERKAHREAHTHGDLALGRVPDAVSTHVVKGSACLRSGRPFGARRHFRAALRIDPTDDDVREMLVEADRCCRVFYLPAYYFGLVVDRLPGGPFALWGAFVLSMAVLSSVGADPRVIAVVVVGYPALCVYTWIASPITRLWMKIVPTR